MPKKGRKPYTVESYKEMALKKIKVIRAKMKLAERPSKPWLLLRKQELSYLARIEQRFEARKKTNDMRKRKDYIQGTLEIIQESVSSAAF